MAWLTTLLTIAFGILRSRAALQIENLAPRHQRGVYRRTCCRPRIRPQDRIFWSWLAHAWSGWREALVFVKPETIMAWRRDPTGGRAGYLLRACPRRVRE